MAKAVEKPAFHIPGVFVKFTFLRLFKQHATCSDETANAAFEALLKSGEIVGVREWNKISIFEYKKQDK